MKSISFVRTIVLLLVVVSLSACNRGYGCPTNFEMNESVTTVVTTLFNLLF